MRAVVVLAILLLLVAQAVAAPDSPSCERCVATWEIGQPGPYTECGTPSDGDWGSENCQDEWTYDPTTGWTTVCDAEPDEGEACLYVEVTP